MKKWLPNETRRKYMLGKSEFSSSIKINISFAHTTTTAKNNEMEMFFVFQNTSYIIYYTNAQLKVFKGIIIKLPDYYMSNEEAIDDTCNLFLIVVFARFTNEKIYVYREVRHIQENQKCSAVWNLLLQEQFIGEIN